MPGGGAEAAVTDEVAEAVADVAAGGGAGTGGGMEEAVVAAVGWVASAEDAGGGLGWAAFFFCFFDWAEATEEYEESRVGRLYADGGAES